MDNEPSFDFMTQTGPRAAFLYETFILNLLAHHLKEQGKTLKEYVNVPTPGGTRMFEVDAVAEQGIDDIPGPVVVEIKLTANLSRTVLDPMLARFEMLAPLGGFKSALLILGRVALERKTTTPGWGTLPSGIALTVWDENDIRALVNKYRAFANGLAANIDALRLTNIVSRSSNSPADAWKQARADHIRELQRAYSESELALFLGAGVSVDAGVPAWDSLLNGMLANLVRRRDGGTGITETEVQELVTRFRTVDNPSPLIAARYLRRGLADAFVDDVTALLYKTIAHNESERVRNSTAAQPPNTLAALARLCVPRRSGPGVRAVVTYNFDDLLEKELALAGVSHRSIYREGDFESKDELAIYHVHGFLPQDRAKYERTDGFEELVFSEEGYHRLFGDPYSWANLVQLNLFRDASCLMLGLSLADPNLRRLLEVSARRNENSYHHAIVRRLSLDAFMKDRDGKVVVTARNTAVERFLALHHQIQDELFAELGVRIVWIEEYSEIPGILRSIAGGKP